MEDTLSEIFTQCWARLLYGSIINTNAFHTSVVGTGQQGAINLRTVVLRTANPDAHEVVFYTDSRSSKINDLNSNPYISFLFYDSTDRVQLRLSGEITIHIGNEVSSDHWSKVTPEGRNSYRAIPGPSTSVDQPADGLEHLKQHGGEDNDGYSNFAVIVTRVNYIEWLSLKKEGHRRAEFRMMDGGWKGQWLIP